VSKAKARGRTNESTTAVLDEPKPVAGSDSLPGKSVSPPNAPWYVKVILLLHLFCITVWALPDPKPNQMSGKVVPPIYNVGDQIRLFNAKNLKTILPLRAYLFSSGSWQYWDMFSPNPSSTDLWVDAEVIYRDGTKKYFLYPRMYMLPIPQKFLQERFRKFFERGNLEGYSYLWPVFAQRIAYVNDNVNNPPKTVRLSRHWLQIANPGKPQASSYKTYMYFEYAVDQNRLQQMRKEL
jgi:hypothetical protein